MKQYETLSLPFTCVKGFFTILEKKEERCMIDLRNVEKTYYSNAGDIHALKKTNLHINAGEIFGIIGLSGAGKSTLIRCINMLEVPTGGQVFVDGQELTAMNNQELRKARQNIGMIFQHFNLLASRTVYDNIAFPLEIQGISQSEIKKRVQPLLELVFSFMLLAVCSAIFFFMDASSGGTDIIALILKKYTNVSIGMALLLVDFAVVVISFFVYNPTVGLFSFAGFLAKSFFIDSVIESLNLCKYFTIVSDNADTICDYIHKELNHSATIMSAEGSYSHEPKKVIMTVVNRDQALKLRKFVRSVEPHAFMMITNSSEIIGKGFRNTM